MDQNSEIKAISTLVLTVGLAWAVLTARPSSGDATHLRRSTAESQLLRSDSEKTEDAGQQNSGTSLKIPAGTILPVRLATSISSEKSRPGAEVTAKIMQDVPLPAGQKLPKGSRLAGTVTAITTATAGREAEISLRFDKLLVKHDEIALTTNLRAIAGYVEVEQWSPVAARIDCPVKCASSLKAA